MPSGTRAENRSFDAPTTLIGIYADLEPGTPSRLMRRPPCPTQHPEPISKTNLLDHRLTETPRAHGLDEILQPGGISDPRGDLGTVEIGSDADTVIANVFDEVLKVLDHQFDGRLSILTTVGTQEAGGEVDAHKSA